MKFKEGDLVKYKHQDYIVGTVTCSDGDWIVEVSASLYADLIEESWELVSENKQCQ